MARPYWSGQIRISLVSFSVDVYVATEAKSEIHFHQIHRDTGERVRHQKVSSQDDAPIESADIVKGYEYSKGQYLAIEPAEIDALRVPSKHTISLDQFVSRDAIPPQYFEKPYFIVPSAPEQVEAFTVVRDAMLATNKIGLGKIAFGGREHILAIMSLPKEAGLMGYTLRYAEELRKPSQYFSEIKASKIEKDQLELAEALIQKRTVPFAPEKFQDQYELALQELVQAKLKKVPLPMEEEPPPKQANVVNLMDALRKSLQQEKQAPAPKAAKAKQATKRGPVLVKAKSSRRKTA